MGNTNIKIAYILKSLLLLFSILISASAKFSSGHTVIMNEGFEGSRSLPAGWSLKTLQGNPWQVAFSRYNSCEGEHTLICSGNRKNESDSWCYTSGFKLEKNNEYTLGFSLKVKISVSPESLGILLIGPDGYKKQLFREDDIDNSLCRRIEKKFTVEEDNTYRLGIHYFSDSEGRRIFLDDISIIKSEVEQFRVIPDTVFIDSSSESFSIKLINNTGDNKKLKFTDESESKIIHLQKDCIILNPYEEKEIIIHYDADRMGQSWANACTLKVKSHDNQVNEDIRVFYYGNRWLDKTKNIPLPFSDFVIGASSDGSYIYAFSGFAGSRAARFDLQNRKWQMLAPPPEDCPEPYSAVIYGDFCYFMSSSCNIMYRYQYDTEGGRYSLIPGPPDFGNGKHFRRPSMAEFGGVIYVMGHVNSPGPYDIEFWKYEIKSESWSELPLPDRPRMLSGMTVKNGRIYFMGGRDRDYLDIPGGDVYDICSESWKNAPWPSIPGNSGYPGVLLRIGSYVFFDRGRLANEIYAFKLYDSSWKKWLKLRSKPSFNFYSGCVIAEGNIHMFGGTIDVPLSKKSVRNIHYIMEHDMLIADAGKGGITSINGQIKLGGETVASGGAPPYKYFWSDGRGWYSKEKNPVYHNMRKDRIEFYLTVQDSKGNTDADAAVYFAAK